MSLQQALFMSAGAQLATIDAANFDGATYMTRSAPISGVPNSKTGILSFWFKPTAGAQFILHNNALSFRIAWAGPPSAYMEIFGFDPSFTLALAIATDTTSITLNTGTWYHLLASWSLSAGIARLYINDTSDVVVNRASNLNIDYTSMSTWWFAHSNTTSIYNGCLADFYFAPNQYLDISLVANRRKFISGTGKPVWLGSDGSAPTGTAPAMYFHLNDAEAAADFSTNLGTCGTFPLAAGAITTCANSPSD